MAESMGLVGVASVDAGVGVYEVLLLVGCVEIGIGLGGDAHWIGWGVE